MTADISFLNTLPVARSSKPAKKARKASDPLSTNQLAMLASAHAAFYEGKYMIVTGHWPVITAKSLQKRGLLSVKHLRRTAVAVTITPLVVEYAKTHVMPVPPKHIKSETRSPVNEKEAGKLVDDLFEYAKAGVLPTKQKSRLPPKKKLVGRLP